MVFICSSSLLFYGPLVRPRKDSIIISHWCKCLAPLLYSTWTQLTPLVGLPMRSATWPWIPLLKHAFLPFFLQPSPVRSWGDYEGGRCLLLFTSMFAKSKYQTYCTCQVVTGSTFCYDFSLLDISLSERINQSNHFVRQQPSKDKSRSQSSLSFWKTFYGFLFPSFSWVKQGNTLDPSELQSFNWQIAIRWIFKHLSGLFLGVSVSTSMRSRNLQIFDTFANLGLSPNFTSAKAPRTTPLKWRSYSWGYFLTLL